MLSKVIQILKGHSCSGTCGFKLIETLVVRDADDIIEQHIRFHHAMGVDGFVVSSHNSTDSTNQILERLRDEGIVLKIFYRTEQTHMHRVWVMEMIKYARQLGAKWVINADVDEFYYSVYKDLKRSILDYPLASALYLDSHFCFPQDDVPVLHNEYFVNGRLTEQQAAEAVKDGISSTGRYVGEQCPKMLHRTFGFRRVCDGNHAVKMWLGRTEECKSIQLYHYSVMNYRQYEKKAARWVGGCEGLRAGIAHELKDLVCIFKDGGLADQYEKLYGKRTFEYLLQQGVVTRDMSVLNFMKERHIV